MRKNLLIPFLGVLCTMLAFSCVKDTDFDQAENIVLTPVVELDLIHFNVESSDYFDPSTGSAQLTVSDTTEIRFLDDSGIQESLKKAEFLFRFTNSLATSFDVNFQFLDRDNLETYATDASVDQGTPENPVVSDFIEVVEGTDILELTKANKVVISATIPDEITELEGTLNLKSKTTYYLEIKERN